MDTYTYRTLENLHLMIDWANIGESEGHQTYPDEPIQRQLSIRRVSPPKIVKVLKVFGKTTPLTYDIPLISVFQ